MREKKKKQKKGNGGFDGKPRIEDSEDFGHRNTCSLLLQRESNENENERKRGFYRVVREAWNPRVREGERQMEAKVMHSFCFAFSILCCSGSQKLVRLLRV